MLKDAVRRFLQALERADLIVLGSGTTRAQSATAIATAMQVITICNYDVFHDDVLDTATANATDARQTEEENKRKIESIVPASCEAGPHDERLDSDMGNPSMAVPASQQEPVMEVIDGAPVHFYPECPFFSGRAAGSKRLARKARGAASSSKRKWRSRFGSSYFPSQS